MTGSGNNGGTRVVARARFRGGDWHGGAWGRCTQTYIGMWEESGRIKIRIRDKI
jgi:hypothetical protein